MGFWYNQTLKIISVEKKLLLVTFILPINASSYRSFRVICIFLNLRHLNQNRRKRPPRLFRPPFFYFVEFFNPLLLIQIPWSYGTEKYELNIWKIRKSNTNSEDLFIINNDDSNQNEVHCQVVKNWKQKFYIDGCSYIPKLIKNRSHCRFKLKWRIIWRRN